MKIQIIGDGKGNAVHLAEKGVQFKGAIKNTRGSSIYYFE